MTGDAKVAAISDRTAGRRGKGGIFLLDGVMAWYKYHRHAVLGTASIVVIVGLWQLCAVTGVVSPIYVSEPSRIVTAGVRYVGSSAFRSDAWSSGVAFSIGFALSILVGIGAGFLVGWFRLAEDLLDYLISITYAAPRIALVPVFIVWFGIGTKTEIAVIFLMGVFPIIINTITGVHTVDRTLLELATSFGSSRRKLLRTIVLPASVPHMLSGIRLAVGTCLIGVIVAEFTASNAGIGHMMENAANSFETDRVFVGLVIISMAGLLLTQLLRRIERHFEMWRVEGDSPRR